MGRGWERPVPGGAGSVSFSAVQRQWRVGGKRAMDRGALEDADTQVDRDKAAVFQTSPSDSQPRQRNRQK